MATNSFLTENQKTNIIIITGSDETLQNFLSVIQKSENYGELADLRRQVVSIM